MSEQQQEFREGVDAAQQGKAVEVQASWGFGDDIMTIKTTLPGVEIAFALDYSVSDGPQNADFLTQSLPQIVAACLIQANAETEEEADRG